MQAKVYQRDPYWDGPLRLVATVDCGDREGIEALEWAYRHTNTVDRAWWEGSPWVEVAPCARGGCRSTSERDAILLGDTLWAVAPIGFTPL